LKSVTGVSEVRVVFSERRAYVEAKNPVCKDDTGQALISALKKSGYGGKLESKQKKG
jgi:hypothetical protein